MNFAHAMAIRGDYEAASILLDGADIPIFHLIGDIPSGEVRMGLRVEAVWAPKDERGMTMESVQHFRPTGEADAAYADYSGHL